MTLSDSDQHMLRRTVRRLREYATEHDVDYQIHELIGNNQQAMVKHKAIRDDCSHLAEFFSTRLQACRPPIERVAQIPNAKVISRKRKGVAHG